MNDLSEKTLDEMIDLAQKVSVLDDCEKVEGTIVFHLGNRTIGVRESFAKTFVRGLLRGYEMASSTRRPGEGVREQ